LLLLRETPISTLHIMNMLKASLGAVIAPASPGFYGGPKLIDDLVDFQIDKVMDLLGLQHNLFKRWASAESIGD
jgi:4-hydroxy-3-polyprenylbenzoate decarboxylase